MRKLLNIQALVKCGIPTLLSFCLGIFFLIGTQSIVYGADVELLVSRSYNVKAGEEATATITLNNNPGITSMGLAVGYDSSTVEYENIEWNSDLRADGNNMLMANDIKDDSQVNVSAVMGGSSAYEDSGKVFATVKFKALKDFSQMPVTVSRRDITGADYQEDVGATIIYEDKKSGGSTDTTETGTTETGTTETGTTETGTTETGTTETGTTENANGTITDPNTVVDDEDDGDEDDNDTDPDYETSTEAPVKTDDTGSGSNSKGNDNKDTDTHNTIDGKKSSGSGSSKTGKRDSKNGLDRTYKTGAVDAKAVFGGLAVLFIAGGGGSMALLKRFRL